MTDRKPMETAAPARNFTIPLADRVRAAGGPMAYMTRRRQIEELEELLLRTVSALLATGDPRAIEAGIQKRPFTTKLARINALIASHNRYYPCEANLPLDPRTGEMLERGVRWRPLEPFSVERLLREARALQNP
jgi:hypothetical protein